LARPRLQPELHPWRRKSANIWIRSSSTEKSSMPGIPTHCHPARLPIRLTTTAVVRIRVARLRSLLDGTDRAHPIATVGLRHDHGFHDAALANIPTASSGALLVTAAALAALALAKLRVG
jgi:hypothetical protein